MVSMMAGTEDPAAARISPMQTIISRTAVPDRERRAHVRIFVVDDHPLVLDGLRSVLDSEPDLMVTGLACSYADAVARLPLADADVAIVDLQLPDGNGADLCRHISLRSPGTRCLVLSSFAHDGAIQEAVRAGAAGYVVKHIDSRELVDCVRRTARGETLLDGRAHAAVAQRARAADADERVARLTTQERQILRHLADGLTNREVGERMHLSEKTVKNYVSSVLAKLGVTRRAAAAVYFERKVAPRGWSTDPDEPRRGAVRF
jgi:two-component system response regulator DevR